MNAPASASCLRWTAITAGAGLLLVGALTAMNRVELTRLAEANPSEAQDARLAALATRVAELAKEAEASRKPSGAVPPARHDAEREAVEARLAAIEQGLNERPAFDDLDLLRARLARLEETLTPPVKPSAARTPARSAPPPEPKIAEPSFQAIGVERRADERFLSILPRGAEGLREVRLLRVGETEDGWRLEAIGEEDATFGQGNKKHRLNLTQGRRP
jgi:hypothetical protein